jgi:hypothetical protein
VGYRFARRGLPLKRAKRKRSNRTPSAVQGFGFSDHARCRRFRRSRRSAPPPPMAQLGFQRAYRIQSRGYQVFQIGNFGNPGDFGNLFSPHPGLFLFSIANKALISNRRTDHAWVALAWPLGGAWVAQGWPNPKPNPNRQRVATLANYQIPRTKYPDFWLIANC